MPPLSSELRNKLERMIIEARDVAEAGAKAALEALAVHHYEPYSHQTPEQRKLRNHLRVHARQLGDRQDSSDRLHIGHLIHECAYEHWHRMLFARFLAENDLLIEPSSGVAVSLHECEELAKEAKTDLWTFASRCAQQMLPQIFRPDDPLLQVTLAREHRGKLEALLNSLPQAVFEAYDSLGWVYQFWQSKKKDDVNASGEKITGDTLPAVTQLFTEHYMVLFLLHNTIGAWHAGKVLAGNPKLAEAAVTEDELRRAVALKAAGGYFFEYLRFVRGQDGKGGPWRPAAGTFEGWPKRVAELKVLDPCCGSGHFLVAVFELLLRLRMDEEGFSLAQASDAVLRENVFGLELDGRCTQIAAFNMALAAWRFGGHRLLPPLHIACSGLAPNSTEQEWVKLAGKDARLQAGMEQLYQLFEKAPVLGSLINPRALGGDMLRANFHELQPLLEKALAGDSTDELKRELAVTAQGIAKAAEIIADEFTLIATNVPYLGQRKQDEILKDYSRRVYPRAKSDLATCFIMRCFEFCHANGSVAVVTPHSWLFQPSYEDLRQSLLESAKFQATSRLGPRAFETIGGEVVNVALIILSRIPPEKASSFLDFDVSIGSTVKEKEGLLRSSGFRIERQADQLLKPGKRIGLGGIVSATRLSQFAENPQGIKTGDDERWIRRFWELGELKETGWEFCQTAVTEPCQYGGRSQIIDWRTSGNGMVRPRKDCVALGRPGIAINQTQNLLACIYSGDRFDSTLTPIVPNDPANLLAILAFCSSADFRKSVKDANPALFNTNSALLEAEFNIEHWSAVAKQQFPNGLPKPHSPDPTQWIFPGYPLKSESSIHVAAARLLGYRWPRQTGSSFHDCPALNSDELERFESTSGIVCIPSVRGENLAADRLGVLLDASGIKPERDLDDWLRNSFFEEHCKLFHHRPFIWHIWDGRKRDGFHALINYHKLAEGNGKGRKLLESLTYSYLGEWINRQQDGVRRGEEGAEDRLAAATELQKRLEAMLTGEPPYDIFVRWKPLNQQPIGWDPDINDGVRLNIRPFLAGDLPNGRAGAGVLRWKPNIKWDKDRGKEPHRSKTDFPWFWGWDGKTQDFMGGKNFTGERFNACHYSIAAKRNAKESAEKVVSIR